MKSAHVLFAILGIAAGCNRDTPPPPDDDHGGALDLAAAADLSGADLSRPDLSVKRGWTRRVVPDTSWLNAVWGSGPSDVYAVGLNGVILHSTGDDVWTQQKTGRAYELTSVFGSSATDVYAVESDAVLHSSGDGHWSVVPNIQPAGTGELRQIWMSSPTNIYVSGSTSMAVPAYPTGGVNIFRWQAPNLVREFAMAQHHIGGFFGTDATDLWAVGSFEQGGGTLGLVLHSTGDGTWTRQSFEPDLGSLYLGILNAVWSSSKGDVYAASGRSRYESYGIFRCSGRGTPWRRETDKMNPPTISGLWGSGPTDVWAVGLTKAGGRYNALVLRSKGDGNWTPDADVTAADLAEHPLAAVWGSRFGDVYAVGHGGLILHKRE